MRRDRAENSPGLAQLPVSVGILWSGCHESRPPRHVLVRARGEHLRLNITQSPPRHPGILTLGRFVLRWRSFLASAEKKKKLSPDKREQPPDPVPQLRRQQQIIMASVLAIGGGVAVAAFLVCAFSCRHPLSRPSTNFFLPCAGAGWPCRMATVARRRRRAGECLLQRRLRAQDE